MGAVTVGLDIGTTSIKAVAVDADGTVVGRVRIPHQLHVPAPDMLEHDADRAWRRGVRRALTTLGPVRPAGVAVTAMVPSLTAVDARGRPRTPGLLYGDRRGRTPFDPPAGAGDPPPAGSGRELAGFLKWTAAAAPDARGYWPAQAVAISALGGRPTVDMAFGFLADPLWGAQGWDQALCRACGADPERLPDVELPGAVVGRLDGEPDGAVLGAGTIDVMCEQLVAGARDIGDVHVICGTSLIVAAVGPPDGCPEPHSSLMVHSLTNPDRRMVSGPSNGGGMFLDWLGRLVGTSAFRGGGRSSGGAVKDLDPASVPVWAPYPRGERAPYHDPGRRASLHDLDLTHGPAAVTRAGWEASGFVVRHLLDLAGVAGRRVVATGGGTRIPGWMQALADCTGLPVHVARDPEGAARGAAFMARIAAGLETSMEDASRWAVTGAVVDPDPRWVAPADSRYKRFLELSGTPS